mmetsp:Transcript_34267/g.87637  ORF Transcript_34267/g.87637 Transcript_34267/m.87637 type:complete len:257 (+) Transcript_34267:244-1014(+)
MGFGFTPEGTSYITRLELLAPLPPHTGRCLRADLPLAVRLCGGGAAPCAGVDGGSGSRAPPADSTGRLAPLALLSARGGVPPFEEPINTARADVVMAVGLARFGPWTWDWERCNRGAELRSWPAGTPMTATPAWSPNSLPACAPPALLLPPPGSACSRTNRCCCWLRARVSFGEAPSAVLSASSGPGTGRASIGGSDIRLPLPAAHGRPLSSSLVLGRLPPLAKASSDRCSAGARPTRSPSRCSWNLSPVSSSPCE